MIESSTVVSNCVVVVFFIKSTESNLDIRSPSVLELKKETGNAINLL